ncbi:MAG: RNA polymerase sigma factor [Gemmatimonadales bacterium]
MPDRRTPDQALLRRIAEGDRAALREFRLRYGTTAYAIAYSVLVDPETAEAAVSEAFTAAWQEAGGRLPRAMGAAAWISQLTREAAGRLLRSA